MHFIGLNDLNRRRIWRLVKGLEKSEQTENETSDIDLENIFVRYIPCTTGLFSEDIKDHAIDHIQAKATSMSDLVSLIEKDLNIPDDQVIELYTCEGYPMHLNYITAKGMYYNIVPFCFFVFLLYEKYLKCINISIQPLLKFGV